MSTKEEKEDHAPAAACSESYAADQSVEIIVESSGLSGVLHSDFTINKDELKAKISFRRLLELDGHKMKKCGNTYKCLCPFHPERTASFHVYDDATGKCYGCDWYGDIFDYEMESKEVRFYEALKNLHAVAANVKRTSPVRKKNAQTSDDLAPLTDVQLATMSEAAKRLADSGWLLSRVADARGWQIETIQKLADEGSLGWYKGALAFLYQTGMKLRNWPHKQPIVWEFGKGESLWRQARICSSQTIYLCEGETDAISLLDVGLEDEDGLAVAALPSASTLPEDLATTLEGKNVIMCMDNDEAGSDATETLYEVLHPVCASIIDVNPGEVRFHE